MAREGESINVSLGGSATEAWCPTICLKGSLVKLERVDGGELVLCCVIIKRGITEA